MKKRTLIIIISILAVAGIGMVVFTRNNVSTAQVQVKAAKVQQDTVIETLSTTGTLVSKNSTNLFGSGSVQELHVALGDTVEKDQILATYDNGLELKSSIKGVVTALNIEKGQPDTATQQGLPSITIEDLANLIVQVQLSNSEAQAVKLEQTVEITTNNQTFSGKVIEKDPVASINQASGTGNATLGAKIAFNEVPENLYASFDVDVDITTNIATDVLAIPIEALSYNDNNEPFVFVIENNRLKKAVLTIGIQSDQLVEVMEGIKNGQEVVLSPTSDLKDGDSVTIK